MCGWCRPQRAGPRAWCCCRWTGSCSVSGCRREITVCTCWAHRSARGAWPRLPARRRRGAGPTGRGLRDPDLPAQPGTCPPPDHGVAGLRPRCTAAGPSRGRASWRPRITACMSSPAAAAIGWLHRKGPVAHAAGLGLGGLGSPTQLSRRALGGWMERVVFSDPRDALPLPLHDFRSRQVALDPAQPGPAVLASCTIPFGWMPVQDVPGGAARCLLGRRHHRLPPAPAYAAMARAWCCTRTSAPAWCRAGWTRPGSHRHRQPRPRWTTWCCWRRRRTGWPALPHGKLPDRGDFKSYGDDIAGRQRDWRRPWPKASGWPTSLPNSWRGAHPSRLAVSSLA
jgi:hypothetical protein